MAEASLFLDLDGTSLTPEEVALLREPLIGGVILFARNTESATQVARLIADIREVNPEAIISIDQEGGRVQRLKEGVTRLPPLFSLYSLYQQNRDQGLQYSQEMGYLMAMEMRLLGIDISFAPVLDIDYGRNTVIGDRAFASDHLSVAELSAAYIQGMSEAGMPATGKHFPGHGWADADTHHAGANDDREFSEIWNKDMLPFRKAIAAGMEALMFAHVTYSACDATPAGYSEFWMKEILRQRLGFDGVLFSDDLSMKAAHSAGGYAERAARAIESDCDILLCCNERAGTMEILEYMKTEGIKPASVISRVRGRSVLSDDVRLQQARKYAMELNGV